MEQGHAVWESAKKGALVFFFVVVVFGLGLVWVDDVIVQVRDSRARDEVVVTAL